MIERHQRVADLALHSPALARLLSEHGINFCCDGSSTLVDACAERGIEVADLLDELEQAARATPRPAPVFELSTSALIDHLVATHHDYIWARLPFLVPMAAKLTRECGRSSPACARLAELVSELQTLVLGHLERDERDLAALAQSRDPAVVRRRLATMHAEHRALGDLLGQVRGAAGLHQKTSASACATERALYGELERLECHLRSQVLIEREILAPRLALAASRDGLKSFIP